MAALLGALLSIPVFAEPLVSPTWGFRLDLPEEYQYLSGDGKDKFSFRSTEGANFEMVVYPPGSQQAQSLEALAQDTQKRLNNKGEISFFTYQDKKAALIELDFSIPAAQTGGRNTGKNTPLKGWGLCVEMDARANGVPILLALAYGDAGNAALEILHLSALDSIAPTNADRRVPGPVTDFSYPRGNLVQVSLAGLGVKAQVGEFDEEGAQYLVDREFEVLQLSASTPRWKQAWTRFYRAIYRDSFSRLGEAAFALERYWDVPAGTGPSEAEALVTAGKALAWVQSFNYERNLLGSDFINLISAAVQGRGDCDSRAMLWAIIMEQANIPAAIMVSADYGHAMGLIDLAGPGARFDWEGKRWLVAETTAKVSLGLIGQNVSDPAHWLGVVF
ncbi:conserved hypothetical protein [Treponema primitia ZAS-2]|uniref:Transglutaminase-like domain-containing protein n=1 Tax=Treponema primitia (strain ATCC BAA-887 / DSM 12427 / ZAS-2) TaxID=545694 RepID=F5YM02_TREPZ|nr:hypothetical protein [Treponema primitia]AEF86232.1 conserved hypothetical protein [Treponema primitia ZAS-2]